MNDYKKEYKIFDTLVYIIMIATLIMIAPLIYRAANSYSFSSPAVTGENENAAERPGNRRYTVMQTEIDISKLKETDFGALNILSAKITDGGAVIMFCESPSEITGRAERVARIAVWNGSDVNILNRRIRYGLCESFINKDYHYKDYGDGTLFISNNRFALLFDFEEFASLQQYLMPENLNIYQLVLSNDKERFAVAAEEGFFIYDAQPSEPQLKELIASSVSGGVLITAREPVWTSGDDYIFYKSYTDNFIKNAGLTTDSPGGNEQLTGLDITDFLFLENDVIFYYSSTGSEPYQENLFRCGFFAPFGDRRMTEVMKSQIYYFDIAVSSHGTHLAALSHNGNMIRLNIIDIRTKKQIYSDLFEDVYDFSFSPDEKKFILHARAENEEILKIIEIDWTEE